ncbi:MAG: hypothetical protein EPN36_04485 [Rhodanobacteraceae bacterium]|nr:MAG: hypothetical protein EPN36_04485 [Rhodanobacteraceae bacterium]
MFEPMHPPRPRVALVYGDADRVGHLRDVVAGLVEIVYETAATNFDATRLADSHATAALVNLDEGDWLDPIEARLNEAGVAVVFNDPEISHGLEGWAQARWLRHLTAKLSGSCDYDPPRPAIAAAAQVDAAPMANDAAIPVELPEVDALAITERPLSPTEIESMTANFVAVQEPSGTAANLGDMSAVEAPSFPETMEPTPAAAIAEAEPVSPDAAPETCGSPDAVPSHAAPAGTDDREVAALDVDTEALSAMIDARLAEPTAHVAHEAPEVWRLVEGGDVSTVEVDPAAAEHAPTTAAAGTQDNAQAPLSSLPVDDSDVLNALPSLGDWQLVDPDAPLAPAAGKKPQARIEPTFSLDFAGLELVPIETASPVAHAQVEPIEQWMHVNDDKVAADKHRHPDANGERA